MTKCNSFFRREASFCAVLSSGTALNVIHIHHKHNFLNFFKLSVTPPLANHNFAKSVPYALRRWKSSKVKNGSRGSSLEFNALLSCETFSKSGGRVKLF
jgi:hypothetical protein